MTKAKFAKNRTTRTTKAKKPSEADNITLGRKTMKELLKRASKPSTKDQRELDNILRQQQALFAYCKTPEGKADIEKLKKLQPAVFTALDDNDKAYDAAVEKADKLLEKLKKGPPYARGPHGVLCACEPQIAPGIGGDMAETYLHGTGGGTLGGFWTPPTDFKGRARDPSAFTDILNGALDPAGSRLFMGAMDEARKMGLLQASAMLLAAPSGRYAAPPDAVLAALQLEVAVNEALGAAVRVEGDAPWTVAGLDAYYQAGLRLSGAIKDQALWKEVEAIIEAGHETPEALVAAIEALPRFKEIDPEAYAAFKAAALAKPVAASSVVAAPDGGFIEDQHIRFSTRDCHPSVHEARAPFLELLDACVNPDQRACIMHLAREEQLDICRLRERLSTMPALQAEDGSGPGPDLSRFLAATREVAEKYATR